MNFHPVNSHLVIFHPLNFTLENPFPVKTGQKLQTHRNDQHLQMRSIFVEAAVQRCSLEKVFWKHAANLIRTWVFSSKFAVYFQNTFP